MPVLAMELATVRRDDKTGKIDHPPSGGKKDVADALAGAVWWAEQGFVNGATSQWKSITTVSQRMRFAIESDNEALWDKVNRGIPLTEDEIYRLK
jgi:hypothetical protein